jgi:VanZ family protein
MPSTSLALRVLLLRIAFFGCVVLLVVLSWLPITAMVRTGVGGRVEHATAYFITAIIMGVAYRDSPRLLVQFLLLDVLAAILEAGQLYIVGRHSSFRDFVASSSGLVVAGLLLWSARPHMLRYLGLDGDFRGASRRRR